MWPFEELGRERWDMDQGNKAITIAGTKYEIPLPANYWYEIPLPDNNWYRRPDWYLHEQKRRKMLYEFPTCQVRQLV